MKNKFVYLIFTILFSACVTDDHTRVYEISGVLHDGTNPKNKFSNVKLTFEDNTYFKNLITLGETFTDSNGYFKFYYETKDFKGDNFLRIYLDTLILTSEKLNRLPLAQNWNKDFYLSDSAKLNIIINKDIQISDSVFFSNGDSIYCFPGPIKYGDNFEIKLINYFQNGLVGYCIGSRNSPNNLILIHCNLTGEPIVDKLILF